MEVDVNDFNIFAVKLVMNFSLFETNDIHSTYELMFSVLSIQILGELFCRSTLQ